MREKAKGEGFLVLDSSYTQAGDPNTMRNFGLPRNIIYNFHPVSELSKNDPDPTPSQRKRIEAGGEADSRLSRTSKPASRKAKAMGLTAKKEPEPYPYQEFYTVCRAQDCTKNMSNSVFTPGDLIEQQGSP